MKVEVEVEVVHDGYEQWGRNSSTAGLLYVTQTCFSYATTFEDLIIIWTVFHFGHFFEKGQKYIASRLSLPFNHNYSPTLIPVTVIVCLPSPPFCLQMLFTVRYSRLFH